MRNLIEFLRSVLIIAGSAFVAYQATALYVAVGMLVLFSVIALLTDGAFRQLQATAALEDPPNLVMIVASIALMSLGLALIWPTIPVLIAWNAAREHRESREDPRDLLRPR